MNIAQIGIIASGTISTFLPPYDLGLDVSATLDPTAEYRAIFTLGLNSKTLICPAPANGTADTDTLASTLGGVSIQAEALRYPSTPAYAGNVYFKKNSDVLYTHVYDPSPPNDDANYTYIFTNVQPGDLLEVTYFEA